MSSAELDELKLLGAAKAARREGDIKRANALFTEFSQRSLARVKSKVANDQR